MGEGIPNFKGKDFSKPTHVVDIEGTNEISNDIDSTKKSFQIGSSTPSDLGIVSNPAEAKMKCIRNALIVGCIVLLAGLIIFILSYYKL